MSRVLEELAKDLEEKILHALESGSAPWIKPWQNDGILPHNPYTGTIYQGINALRLLCDEYTESKYLTFNEIKALNGSVRKGERASYVLFVGQKPITQEERENTRGYVFEDEEGRLWQKIFKKIPIFNITQCQNLDMQLLAKHQKQHNIHFEIKQRDRFQENPFIEQILKNSHIPIIHYNKDRAYYCVNSDTIYLPPKENFATKEQYYSTALHELGHATGAKHRLGRALSGDFGSVSYAKEELRAELYSFLQALELGIDYDIKNHASYVKGWLKILQDDKSEISRAIKDGVRMVSFVKEQWYPTKEQERTPQKARVKPRIQNKLENELGLER